MITVFSNNQVVCEFDDLGDYSNYRRAMCTGNYEFYNSCCIYVLGRFSSGWGRMDGTPLLLEDVPKETRALALLMGLS